MSEVPGVRGRRRELPGLVSAMAALCLLALAGWMLVSRLRPGNAHWPMADLTKPIEMKMVHIRPGDFWMGSTTGETDEQPAHCVRITRPFYLGLHEVTRGQFRRFVQESGYRTEPERDGEGGWGWNTAARKFEGRDSKYNWQNTSFAQTDEHPVVNVTWNDAVAFCDWLSRKEGKQYRLPTEAEWEYACRAGGETAYHSGDDPQRLVRVANVADASLQATYATATWGMELNDRHAFTSPVGSFTANAFGLHDMHGNVWEWCADWYGEDYYSVSASDDPQGPAAGSKRVNRGGSWASAAALARSANRSGVVPSSRDRNIGFRVASVPSAQ